MNTWFRQNYENIFRALCVAALIPVTFICTGLTIFFANQSEVSGTISSFLPIFGQMIALVVFILFLVQFPFLFIKRNWFPLLNSLILAVGFLFWLHANVFNWNFGILDGSSIDWKSFQYLAYRELFFDTLVLGILFWRYKWFSKYAIHFACILMFMQS
ncbi:MAG: hypothetical protein LBC74_13330, partial [Planctomycetaceae bacterium]|nr:hypothetical protein [Planctomycetaceae bacterium]